MSTQRARKIRGLSVFLASGLLFMLGAPIGAVSNSQSRFAPGVLVVDEPRQTSLVPPEHWTKGAFRITAIARYELTARLVQRHEYWFDRESAVAPLDFTVAWGVASDQLVQDAISVNLAGRNFKWRAKLDRLPTDANSISDSMANMHLVPASEAVLNDLKAAREGSLIKLSGYLVNIDGPSGFRWTSSLSRNDSGDGACELMWVEHVGSAAPQTNAPKGFRDQKARS